MVTKRQELVTPRMDKFTSNSASRAGGAPVDTRQENPASRAFSNGNIETKKTGFTMHDFRIQSNRRRQFQFSQDKQPMKNTLAEHGAKIMRKGSMGQQLEPIPEAQGAHITHLMKKYQGALPQQRQTSSAASVMTELSQVDNGIMFLDNYDAIVNPTNMKTPPPPVWGDPLDEDDYDGTEEFYAHGPAMEKLKERKRYELAKLEAAGGKTQS